LRLHRHQALSPQERDRLADGCGRNAEFGGKRIFRKPLTGQHAPLDDHFANGSHDLVDQQRRTREFCRFPVVLAAVHRASHQILEIVIAESPLYRPEKTATLVLIAA